MTALHQLRRERDVHEHALEAAMEAIRQHTQAIERVERDIEVIETAMAGSSGETPPAIVEDEYESSEETRVHQVPSAVSPPRPPPLRPVPMHRAVG